MFIKFLSASFYTIWHGIYRSGPELETNRNCDFTVQSPRKLAMLYFEYNRSFFLTQKHIYSLQYTGCSWFVSFYKCRDITIKNMLFMSLITVRLRDPPSHKDDHRENVQNDFFFFCEKLHRKWFQKYRYIWLNDKSVPMTEYQSMLTHAYLSVVQEDMVRCNLNIKTGNW